MNLSDIGIEMQPLTFHRQLAIRLAGLNNKPSSGLLTLELRAPMMAAKGIEEVNGHLLDLKYDCLQHLSGKPLPVRAYGDFTIRYYHAMSFLDRPGNERLLEAGIDFTKAMCFGNGRWPSQRAFELDPNDPQVQPCWLEFRSWMVFGVTARLPAGKLTMELVYPEGVVAGKDRRPIDEIDMFLTAAAAWYLRALVGQLTSSINALAEGRPGETRKLTFAGRQDYFPIGGGYGFNESWLQAQTMGEHFPSHAALLAVAVAFRQELSEQVRDLWG